MSVAGQGPSTGTENADILSQALLQTGLSNSIKLEAENVGFDEHLLACDVQTLTNDLISTLDNNSGQGNAPPPPVFHPGVIPKVEGQFAPIAVSPNVESFQHLGGNGTSIMGDNQLPSGVRTSNGSFIDGHGKSGGVPLAMPKLKKMENGIVPHPHQPQPLYTAPGDSCNSNYGGGSGMDIDLEELLSGSGEQTDEVYQPSPCYTDPNYPVPINGQNSFPSNPPPQYGTFQATPINQDTSVGSLPELMNEDLLGFLGKEEGDFLESLVPANDGYSSYNMQNEVVSSGERQADYVGPTGFISNTSFPNAHRPYPATTRIAATPPNAPMSGLPGYRPQQPPNNSNGSRQFLLQQQQQQQQQQRRMAQQQRLHGRIGDSAPSNVPKQPLVPLPAQEPGGDSDEDEDDDDDFTGVDTYANYVPTKVKIGRAHPDPVVESSSLSSVEPPDVYFDLKLPREAVESGKLSSLQLESVIYTCQQHMNILPDGTRSGFLVGDGAGVGKGRIIAGIIYQNYLEGRKKAVWLSVSNDLRLDAGRDFKDVGAKKIDIYSLNKFHYGKISGKRNGRVRKGVVFATYSSLIGESTSGGKYKTRFDQLVHWLGSQFEGVIVFDECHKAKNLVPTGAGKPSKTGMTVLQLQKKLPKARIVYCSATGASEPKNMAYMSRLGIWGRGTQFNDFQDFIKAVERRGVGAMEIVAIDMKLRGMYMARQLSFCGVSFSISEVKLTDRFVEAYDASVKLWVETRRLFQEASELMDYDRQKLKTMWGQFWASHQRFFKYMCIAAKVQETIRLTKQALSEGKCVVIGLQSTGEARTLEQLGRSDGELRGFVSTTKGVLETLIRRHFPSPTTEPDWSLMDNDPTPSRRRRQRKKPVGPRECVPDADSDSDDSSDSPERSDSAVESSSDEGERSSEGSGSSSSESEGEDNDINPFGSDFSEPWLQKKKLKAKSRKRAWSPSNTSKSPQKKKRNFSIKPPPHSSKKGKTKTGFNSKKLKFEDVQSPDTHSNRPSPSSSHHPLPSTLTPINQAITESVGRGVPHAFSSVQGGGGGGTPVNNGSANSAMDKVVIPGQNLVDAMSSKFIPNIPAAGTPLGGQFEMLQNGTVKRMKEELLKKLEVLSPHLPTNTLDELIDGLGGTRSVAEMTGRRGRVVSLPGGGVQYQLRSEQDVSTDLLNIREKQRFMDGEKHVAIISEAASSGISLQADRRVKNQKRRVHMTLELPWSADRAIQQFGRTHRSNQVNAPEYVFLISTLSGEQRFASTVAKRLQSLGALTHGDRRATETRDLSKYNVDTKYGRQALEKTVRTIAGVDHPNIKMDDYPKDFFEQCRGSMVGVGLFKSTGIGASAIEKDATTMSRFLNRILGLPVKLQNQLFSYFSDTLEAVVQKAKRTGHWDGGILDFGSSGEHVQIVATEQYAGDPAYNIASAQLYTIEVERGMSFDEALVKLNKDSCPGEGFYTSKRVCNGKQTAVLLKMADASGKYFLVYRPNTGSGRMEKLSKLLKKYDKVGVEEGKKWWIAQYESSLDTCNHAFWQGRCRRAALGCLVGLRRKTYFMLGGSVLGVWSHIEGVFNRHAGHNQHQRMQIIRVKTQFKRLVGILVPKSCVEDMRRTLASVSHQEEGTSDNPITL